MPSDPKANIYIKFGVNLIKIQGIISDFTHQPKSNFCQAYRVNHFENQAVNWLCKYIRGVVKNQSSKRQQGHEA